MRSSRNIDYHTTLQTSIYGLCYLRPVIVIVLYFHWPYVQLHNIIDISSLVAQFLSINFLP